MSKIRIHQFSPQRSDPEQLEAILVARHNLLASTIEKIRNSAESANKHHSLFVGPRGIGKTMMLTLINHRVSQNKDFNSNLRIAWLNEDETSSKFLNLLVRICRSLSSRYPEEFPAEDVQSVIGLPVDEAYERLSKSLLKRVGRKTILLMIENLDSHFAKFKPEEQRRWRGFIQDNPVFTTVATAQRLFDGVSKRDHPFFGFFDTHHLQPLDVEQTLEMLLQIAELNRNDQLRDALSTPRGKARLETLHFLAGGNPRLYVLLSELITEDSLDDVIGTFEDMVDRQLTSYYQERLRWLSTQQQEIIQTLCRFRFPVSVKTICENLFATNQTISGQLTDLRDYGYVRPYKDGRETRYELAEPLMRLVMEVKETSATQPLGLLVDFLRLWFERNELEAKLNAQLEDGFGRKYIQKALEKYDEKIPQSVMAGSEQLWEPGKSNGAKYDNSQLGASHPLMESAYEHFRVGKYEEVISDCTRLIELDEAPVDQVCRALVIRGVTYGKQGQLEQAISDFTRAIESDQAPVDYVCIALFYRGITYGKQGQLEQAISDFTCAIESDQAPVYHIALFHRGITYGQQGQVEQAISDYTRVIELDQAPVDRVCKALVNRGLTYEQQGQLKQAISDYTSLIEMDQAPVDQVCKALLNRGLTYGQQGQLKQAILDNTSVIELDEAPADQVCMALISRAAWYGLNGHLEQAISDYTSVIEMEQATLELVCSALIYRGAAFAKSGKVVESVADLRRMLSLEPNQLVDATAHDRDEFCQYVIDIVFLAGPTLWDELINLVLEKIDAMELLPLLGQALIRELGVIPARENQLDDLKNWVDSWKRFGTTFEALVVPLRLLEAGIDYIISKKENALLNLPLEERTILKQALGIEKSE